jgi:hypothetical protein
MNFFYPFELIQLLESYDLISERGEIIITEHPRFVFRADVTYQHLKGAMLVGKPPFKALKADSRISYSLYIPPEHLNPDLSLQSKCGDLNPDYKLPLLPRVIDIHETGRNAETCRDSLRDSAQSERVAVLAPLFPAGIDS